MANDARFPAIIVGAPLLRAEAAQALTLAGGVIDSTFDWDEVTGALDRFADVRMVLLETEGVAPALLAAALPEIVAASSAMQATSS